MAKFCTIIDTTRTFSNTLLRRLTSIRTAKEELCNEINLLYVAFTRAKYALHVLTSEAEPHNAINAAYASCYAPLLDIDGLNIRKLDLLSEEDRVREGNPVPVLDCPDKVLLASITQAARFAYGYDQASNLPVKSSASRLLW